MARYTADVTSSWSPDAAFDDLADLRSFAEWDPGVTTATQVVGDGPGPDAEFDLTVRTGPGSTTLRYRTVHFDRPRVVHVVATSPLLTSDDTITVEPTEDGCRVTYDAELRLAGPLRLADPLLRLAFGRIGDRAAAGLRERLAGQEPARRS